MTNAQQEDRERKGAFYTPPQWVLLSQSYLAKNLGSNWQQTHYVWDCAAGTGNLLHGLNNPQNTFASTIDPADVQTIISKTKSHSLSNDSKLNLKPEHIFQFDFLNDDLLGEKVPPPLQSILADTEKRTKLILYINPPYAEATSTKTPQKAGRHKPGVATSNRTYINYRHLLAKASNELYAQFLIRIFSEIPGCTIAHFATLKLINGSNFAVFRKNFTPKLLDLFLVPSFTFSNVKGRFPIGFFIWNTASSKSSNDPILAQAYDPNGNPLAQKRLRYPHTERINRWAKRLDNAKSNIIGYLENPSPSRQSDTFVNIDQLIGGRHSNYMAIAATTLIPAAIYFSVRTATTTNWLNQQDQYYSPNDQWINDLEFHADCLAYALLHPRNRITRLHGHNHWIPYSENEVGAQAPFQSHFMHNFIHGILAPHETPEHSAKNSSLFPENHYNTAAQAPYTYNGTQPISFSPQALALLDAGRQLWTLYHAQHAANPNAAHYDIRIFFQGVSPSGRLNPTSTNEPYNRIRAKLSAALCNLAEKKIAPKCYEYGFLI